MLYIHPVKVPLWVHIVHKLNLQLILEYQEIVVQYHPIVIMLELQQSINYLCSTKTCTRPSRSRVIDLEVSRTWKTTPSRPRKNVFWIRRPKDISCSGVSNSRRPPFGEVPRGCLVILKTAGPTILLTFCVMSPFWRVCLVVLEMPKQHLPTISRRTKLPNWAQL